MFDEIGKKIKALAEVVCWIGIGASIIIAFSLFGGEHNIALGVVALLLGPLFSWLSSLVLYGFGELVDKTCDIERNTRRETKSDTQATVDHEREKKLGWLRASGEITEEEYQQAMNRKQGDNDERNQENNQR